MMAQSIALEDSDTTVNQYRNLCSRQLEVGWQKQLKQLLNEVNTYLLPSPHHATQGRFVCIPFELSPSQVAQVIPPLSKINSCQ